MWGDGMKVKDICDLINGRAFKPSDWGTEGIPIVRIRTLDLNRAFSEIADSLDRIVYECFGVTLKRIA